MLNPQLKLNPKVFNEKLGIKESEAFESIEEEKKTGGDTPISRVAKLLFHIGLHELTHLLYPDSYGDENFHRNITKLEILCHDVYEDIKQETKKYMKQLKTKSAMLLTIIAKQKKGKIQESVIYNGLTQKQKSSTVVAAIYAIISEKLNRQL